MEKVGGNLLISKNYKRGIRARVIDSVFLITFVLFLLINITFISAQKYTLKVTDEHPFFVNNEWIPAKELKVGDSLITDDGKKAKITSIKEINDNVEVYNLEANPFNDFIVEGNVVVHNSNEEVPAEVTALLKAEIVPLKGKFGVKLKKYEGLMDKIFKGKTLSSSEVQFLFDFAKSILEFHGLKEGIDFRRVSGIQGDYFVLEPTDTTIGKLVKKYKEKFGSWFEVRLDPLRPYSEYEWSIGWLALQPFIDPVFLFEAALHEFGHGTIDIKFRSGATFTPLEDLRLSEIRFPEPVPGYRGIVIDEIVQYWRSIVELAYRTLGNPFRGEGACLDNLRANYLIGRIEKLMEFSRKSIVPAEDFKNLMNLLNSRNINEIALNFVPDSSPFVKYNRVASLQLPSGQYADIFITQFKGRWVVQVTISYQDAPSGPRGSMNLMISDSSSLASVDPILSQGVSSRANKETLLRILNQRALPQAEALSESAKHSSVAMESLRKELEYISTLKDNNQRLAHLCIIRQFLARMQLARGLTSGPVNSGFPQYYDNPQNVPRISQLPEYSNFPIYDFK